jgi:hypothetical protein
MSSRTQASSSEVLHIGPDEVSVVDNCIAIDARHRMPDWEVREFEPVPIYFQDEKYLLIQIRKAQPPFAARYMLQAWPSHHVSKTKIFWSYDEEAVADREAHLRRRTFEEIVRAFLMPVYPVLGLFWSGTQQRLTRFGFVPRSITYASIFMVFSLVFLQGVFLVITIFAATRGGPGQVGGLLHVMIPGPGLRLGPLTVPSTWLDLALALIGGADFLVRFTHYLKEDQWTGGFLEWLRPAPKA